MRILFCLVLSTAVFSGCSCSDDPPPSSPDAGVGGDAGDGVDAGPGPDVDAGPGPDVDAGPGTDAGPGATTPREITFQSSGGGESSSAGFRLRLSVGAPEPMGTSMNASNSVTTGPNAARP